MKIYIDGDACPVKNEIYKVARRLELAVVLVANQWMQVPPRPKVELVVVDDGFDAADDWIAERCGPTDIVITSDIPLAGRCVAQGAGVLTPKGHEYHENNVQGAMATRDLLHELRGAGEITGGPAPMTDRDRSTFLQRLDTLVQKKRKQAGN